MQLCNTTVVTLWNSSSQVWFSGPWSPQGQNYFHNDDKKVMRLLFRAETWTDSGKPRLIKDPQHQSRQWHHAARRSFFFTSSLPFMKTSVIPIKSSPWEHKLWWRGSAHEALPLHTRHTACLQEKLLCTFHVGGEVGPFPMKHHFSLKKMTDKLQLFRLRKTFS